MRRDVVSFRSVADRLWRPFATPIVDGTYGTRDFSKLLVAKRHLFNTEEPVQDGQISELDDGSVAVGSRGMSATSYH